MSALYSQVKGQRGDQQNNRNKNGNFEQLRAMTSESKPYSARACLKTEYIEMSHLLNVLNTPFKSRFLLFPQK